MKVFISVDMEGVAGIGSFVALTYITRVSEGR